MGPVLPPTNISEPRTYYNLNSCSGEGDRPGESRCVCRRMERQHPYEVLEIVENAKNENRSNCNNKQLYQNSDVINVELKNGRSLRNGRSHAPCSELRLDVNMQNGNCWSSLDFSDSRSSLVASQPRSCSSLVASQPRSCSSLVASQPRSCSSLVACQSRTSLGATQPHSLMTVIQPSSSLVATLPRSSLVASEPRPSPGASEPRCCNIDREADVSFQNQLLKSVQESQVIIRMSPSPSPPVTYQNISGVKKVFNYDEDDVTDSYSRVTQFSSDHERLKLVYRRLQECVFYRGPLSSADAKVILKPFPVGTFLLRDSSDSGHLFSISVQTKRGPTSVRIVYEAGQFSLDCDPDQHHLMITADCIIQLIQDHVTQRHSTSWREKGKRNKLILVDNSKRKKDVPVLLVRPHQSQPSELRHICRRNINALLGPQHAVDRLQLIPSLKDYLKSYPYEI